MANTLAEISVDGWEPVPGPVLFTLLLLIGTAFVLLPIRPDESFADRVIYLSPFVCLHGILARVVEIIAFRYARGRFPNATDPSPATVHRRSRRTLLLLTQLSAMFAVAFLYRTRHASWTTLIGELYIVHHAANYFSQDRLTISGGNKSGTAPERNYDVRRISSVLFAALANWTLSNDIGRGHIPPLYIAISNGIAADVAYFFANPPERDYGGIVLVGQVVSLACGGAGWFFSFSPMFIPFGRPCGDNVVDFDKASHFILPMAFFQLALFGYVCSCASLELASEGVKFVVGFLWLAMAGWYYCWCFPLYAGLGLPHAEHPPLSTLLRFGS